MPRLPEKSLLVSESDVGGGRMKPKAKMLLLTCGLMLPYMGFISYRVFTYHQRPFQFPAWFLYVAPCYFFGSIALLVILRKKIEGDTPPEYSDRRKIKWLWFGVGLILLSSLTAYASA